MKEKKLFVIGLDGLSFNILDQIRDEYGLENINRIFSKGAKGPLRSVLPHSSAPNWASLTTGVNPGKHGFYSFFFPKKNAYEHQFPNSTYVKVNRIWDFIGNSGKRVLSVNVPGTYPPKEINGCMITGMLTPDMTSDFSYPPSIASEIREKFPGYAFDTKWKQGQSDGYNSLIDALLDSVRNRCDLIFYLLNKYQVDFAMIVFTETDRLFHSALHLIDKSHPYFDKRAYEKNKDNIIEIFKVIDAAIGKIMDKYLDGGNVVIISDHGFSPIQKRVYLNNWLYEQGYFNLCDDDSNSMKAFIKSSVGAVLRALNISDKKRYRLQTGFLSFLREIKGNTFLGNVSSKIINKVDSMSYIDWSKTKAYYLQEWGIRINLKGREPRGIIEKEEYESIRQEIMRSLMAFRDPENEKPIFKEVLKREDVCFGEHFENAPDIFLIAEDNPGYELTSDLSGRNVVDGMGKKTGEHSLFGIFAMYGEDIQNVSVDNMSVVDIVPTVLYALGLPVPGGLDGKVVREAFTKDYLEENKIISDSETVNKDVDSEEFNEEDKEIIKDRLKGLGYY